MKKFLALLLAMMMLLSVTAVAEEATGAALTQDVVILFTSDAHCGIDQGWGYAGVAAVRDSLAKSNHVVLVDNGDAIQGEPIGTMTQGKTIVELMNKVGYDIVTIGNHEFDYGMENFLDLAQNVSEHPYISVNFCYKGEPVFAPYAIREFDGVKIAFVGITTPRTTTSSTPKYFQDEEGNFVYTFLQDDSGELLYNAVQKAVDDARAEGAQYVVAMGHMGIEESCSPWMSTEIITNTTGIDFFLDGHAHETEPCNEVKNKAGDTVLRVGCGTKLSNIGWAKIGTDGKLSTGLYRWDIDVPAPELLGLTGEVADAVNASAAELDAALGTVVASSQVELYINDPVQTDVRLIRTVETNLGDLCADAYRAMTGADVAFVNGGGIRVSIPAGDITMNDIYKVHPFGNALCMVEVSGQQILDALEWGARAYPSESGGFLHVSGLTYEIHSYVESSATMDENGLFTGVAGEYRVKNVTVGGEPLDLAKSYTLASHNYMLKDQGDGFNMFDAEHTTLILDETMLDNQVLITYITDVLGGVVGEEYADPYGQGRIVVVSEAQ